MTLGEFLQSLFEDGRILIGAAPGATPDGDAAAVLAKAHRTAALDVAGSPLPFDEPAALAAARLTYHAAWYLLSRDEPESGLEKNLVMPMPPAMPARQQAARHFAADVVLRYVPALYRRSRALGVADALTRLLAQLLRTWPLSGVLADLDDEPLTPLDFGGHGGLQLLYAERLARHEKTAWFPGEFGRDHVELVWRELGQDPSTLPAPLAPAPTSVTAYDRPCLPLT